MYLLLQFKGKVRETKIENTGKITENDKYSVTHSI